MAEHNSTPQLYARTINRTKKGVTIPIPANERRRLGIEGGRDVVSLRSHPTIDDPQLLVVRKASATHRPRSRKWPVGSGARIVTVRSSGNISIPQPFANSSYLTPPVIDEDLVGLSEFFSIDLRKNPRGLSEFLGLDWGKVYFLGRTGSANLVVAPPIVLAERLAPAMEMDTRNFLLAFIEAVRTIPLPEMAITPPFTSVHMAQAFPEAQF